MPLVNLIELMFFSFFDLLFKFLNFSFMMRLWMELVNLIELFFFSKFLSSDFSFESLNKSVLFSKGTVPSWGLVVNFRGLCRSMPLWSWNLMMWMPLWSLSLS